MTVEAETSFSFRAPSANAHTVKEQGTKTYKTLISNTFRLSLGVCMKRKRIGTATFARGLLAPSLTKKGKKQV